MAIDYEWLEGHLAEHPSKLQFSTFDNRKVIVAPPKNAQNILVSVTTLLPAHSCRNAKQESQPIKLRDSSYYE